MPDKPRHASSPRLSVTEQWAPGVRGPGTEAPTSPPPAPDRRNPPRGYEAPRKPLQSVDESWGEPEPLPPPRPKLDSMETSAARLLDELSTERAQSAELRRQLREHDAAYRAPVVERAPSPRSSLPPKRTDWIKLSFQLGGAVALFLGGLGTYLGARAATKEQHSEVIEAKTEAQKVIVDPLPTEISALKSDVKACKEWASAYSDYRRQIDARVGVITPAAPNAKPYESIKVTARLRKPNSVTSAPLLEVSTPPPTLP